MTPEGSTLPPSGSNHDAAGAVEIDQRVKRFGFAAAHLMEFDVEVLRLGDLEAKLVLAIRRLGHVQHARLIDAAALAGFALQLGVELHRVVLQLRQVVVVVQPVDARRGVPGRTRRQLVAFQQNDILPAQLGEVVEDAAARPNRRR